MTIVEQISTLEELAVADAELKVVGEELANERASLSQRKSTLRALEERITKDRAHLVAVEKLKTDYIIEVRTMMQQVDHSRDKMNRSRTERETNAVTREFEELRKLMRDREDEIGKLSTDADSARQSLDSIEAEAKLLASELGENEGAINTKLGMLDSSFAAKSALRAEIVKRLPSIVFRRYDQVRGKRGSGLAQTTDGTCKACHMSLPPQLFHKLRREPMLEQCPSCARLIYYQAPVAIADPAAKA